jgi:hypothetical protein
MAKLLGPDTLHHLPAGQAHEVTGRSFFPDLISSPFTTPPSSTRSYSRSPPAWSPP